jgi:hypothetical protein
MSFSINESKLEELLKSCSKTYEVSTSAVGLAIDNFAPYYMASGTTSIAPPVVTEEAREHLLALRRNIEESGISLKSADDLAVEIRERR